MRIPGAFGRRIIAIGVVMAAVGCSDATEPLLSVVQGHRAKWTAHSLTKYAYDYKLTGFLVSYANHTIHIVVISGVVASATDMQTGQMLTPPSQWPTIDALFDQAIQAAAAGALRGSHFDALLDYPTELVLAGPPDASGTLFASGLTLLP